MAIDDLQTVLDYHDRSKHRPERFAPSLGYLDWANQPDPFRRYDGAPRFALPEVPPTEEPSFDALFTPGAVPSRTVDVDALGQLLYDSMALSAWKRLGAQRWSLRVNPSSGNLHPTEAYLLCGALPGLASRPGLYHYAPLDHALELRRGLELADFNALTADLPDGSLLLGLTSIHWREAWKYGVRAYRYCQHDVGHAVAAISMAAAALGWRARLLDGADDEDVAALLGIHEQRGADAEHADVLLALSPDGAGVDERARRFRPSTGLVRRLRGQALLGTPNTLSAEHHEWPEIDEVAHAARRGGAPPPGYAVPNGGPAPVLPAPELPRGGGSARALIRGRRSALALDGQGSMPRAVFEELLRRTLPGSAPLAALPWAPQVDLLLFVHRVDELPTGLYLLARSAERRAALVDAMDGALAWQPIDDGPTDLPLFLLEPGDFRRAARLLSCQQAIASDGVFAVAMLGAFDEPLRRLGGWFYRRLLWECGAIGQLLYLGAEAAGMRGTGIGCYFDDKVHEMLGLDGPAYQSLYHFTVGAAIDDPRLQSEPAYPQRASDEGG